MRESVQQFCSPQSNFHITDSNSACNNTVIRSKASSFEVIPLILVSVCPRKSQALTLWLLNVLLERIWALKHLKQHPDHLHMFWNLSPNFLQLFHWEFLIIVPAGKLKSQHSRLSPSDLLFTSKKIFGFLRLHHYNHEKIVYDGSRSAVSFAHWIRWKTRIERWNACKSCE